ncbi:hypothetical protein WICPIJ_009199 [Wickerhamomyces pijperi]|uniref:Uncharacterized protein n=1 Tax=Wickerhamomyces pijperi TaxID=599730 RepID=A0A9P8TE24_WICPI|nr:hypothetical protein WICPIJ_009199 [Wickerhamomyces pijperi]
MELQYVDPVLSTLTKSSNPQDHDNIDDDELSAQAIHEIMKSFTDPSYNKFGQFDRIIRNCHQSVKLYKFFINLKYNELNSWEFLILKTSVNLNFNYDEDKDQRSSFDINIARKCIDKCSDLDDILDENADTVDRLVSFIQKLSIQEYISDPGTLLIKIYFKILNLKNHIVEQISVFYTKSKLLIISYELNEIVKMIEQDENPIVADDTDYKSTLESYKNFVAILITQLDQAVADKDSEQIEECLNILNDVEKMYESVRMQFFYTEEINDIEEEFLNEYNEQQRVLEDSMMSSTGFDHADYGDSSSSVDDMVTSGEFNKMKRFNGRRTSISSTTSTLHSQFNPQKKTTISEELPYLLQAFDEAKHLEEELKEYNSYTSSKASYNYSQQHKNKSSTTPSSASSSTTASSILSSATLTAPYSYQNPLSPTLSSSSASSATSPILDQMNKRTPLQAGFTGSNIGFGSSLLNNIYGLHPKGKVFSPSSLHNQVD